MNDFSSQSGQRIFFFHFFYLYFGHMGLCMGLDGTYGSMRAQYGSYGALKVRVHGKKIVC